MPRNKGLWTAIAIVSFS